MTVLRMLSGSRGSGGRRADTSDVSDAYSPGVLARLVAVKDRYDPGNVFRINNIIAPSAGLQRREA